MIRCVAIDDSPLALDLLSDYISRVPFLKLENKFTNALEALPLLKSGHVDLLFLDIQMPDISGIDLMRGLANKPKVIFTTAFSNYAVEGFNFDASDFLLKPYSFDRFSKAVNKVKKELESEQLRSQPVTEDKGKFIFLKSGYENVKVYLKDILYIEAMKDYVQVYTTEKKLIVLMSMKSMLALLPTDEFIRAHRSYIVPISRITRTRSNKINIEGKEIPIGDMFRESFFKRLNERLSG